MSVEAFIDTNVVISHLDTTGWCSWPWPNAAAALQAGARRLLSEDLQHGQRVDGLVIENPFLDA